MNFYEEQAREMLNAISDHKAGKVDSASLNARASALRSAAEMLKLEVATARHGGLIGQIRPAWVSRLESAPSQPAS